VLSVVDGRSSLLSLDQSIQRAFDPYAFVRNAWLQRREYKVRDGNVPDEEPLDEDFDEPADAGDQPADVAASSSSDTSLMPASAETADGRLR
jgi:phospholipid-binding lipoprotein MlaA